MKMIFSKKLLILASISINVGGLSGCSGLNMASISSITPQPSISSQQTTETKPDVSLPSTPLPVGEQVKWELYYSELQEDITELAKSETCEGLINLFNQVRDNTGPFLGSPSDSDVTLQQYVQSIIDEKHCK